jgi:hypothetical protein
LESWISEHGAEPSERFFFVDTVERTRFAFRWHVRTPV